MRRVGGQRRKTRYIWRKKAGTRGKISLAKYFQGFEPNERVTLTLEPAVQKGPYFRRFHGRSGVFIGMQGECCKVRINDRGKSKQIIVHPVHLTKG